MVIFGITKYIIDPTAALEQQKNRMQFFTDFLNADMNMANAMRFA